MAGTSSPETITSVTPEVEVIDTQTGTIKLTESQKPLFEQYMLEKGYLDESIKGYLYNSESVSTETKAEIERMYRDFLLLEDGKYSSLEIMSGSSYLEQEGISEKLARMNAETVDELFDTSGYFSELEKLSPDAKQNFATGFQFFAMEFFTNHAGTITTENEFEWMDKNGGENLKIALEKYEQNQNGETNAVFMNPRETQKFLDFALSGKTVAEIEAYLAKKENANLVMSESERHTLQRIGDNFFSTSAKMGLLDLAQKPDISTKEAVSLLQSEKVEEEPYDFKKFIKQLAYSPIAFFKLIGETLAGIFGIDFVKEKNDERFAFYKPIIDEKIVADGSIFAGKKLPDNFLLVKGEYDSAFLDDLHFIIGDNKERFPTLFTNYIQSGGAFETFVTTPEIADKVGPLVDGEEIHYTNFKKAVALHRQYDEAKAADEHLTVAAFAAALAAPAATSKIADTNVSGEPEVTPVDTSGDLQDPLVGADGVQEESTEGLRTVSDTANNLLPPETFSIEDEQLNMINIEGLSELEVAQSYSFEKGKVFLIGPDGQKIEQNITLTAEQLDILKNYEKAAILSEIVQIWLQKANQVADRLLFDGVEVLGFRYERGDGKIIKENITKIQETLGALFSDLESGQDIGDERINKIWGYILAAEKEESIIGEDDMISAKTVLLSNKTKDEKLLEIYDLLRYQGLSGNSEGVKESLSNHLLGQDKFKDITAILENENLYAYIKGDRQKLIELVGSSALADSLIEAYKKSSNKIEKQREEFEANILPDINRQRQEAGQDTINFFKFKELNLHMSMITLAKHSLLRHQLANQQTRGNGNDYETMYANLVGLSSEKGAMDYFRIADENIDTMIEVGATLAISVATMGAGGLVAAGVTRGLGAIASFTRVSQLARIPVVGFAARSTVSGIAFYEGTTIASNIIYGNNILDNTTNKNEIVKSVAMMGAFRLMQKAGAKITSLSSKVPPEWLRIGTGTLAEAGVITSTSYGVEMVFEGDATWSWEEYLQALVMAGILRKAGAMKPNTTLTAKKGKNGIEIATTSKTKSGTEFLVNQTNGKTAFVYKKGTKDIPYQIKADGTVVTRRTLPNATHKKIQTHVHEQLSQVKIKPNSANTGLETTTIGGKEYLKNAKNDKAEFTHFDSSGTMHKYRITKDGKIENTTGGTLDRSIESAIKKNIKIYNDRQILNMIGKAAPPGSPTHTATKKNIIQRLENNRNMGFGDVMNKRSNIFSKSTIGFTEYVGRKLVGSASTPILNVRDGYNIIRSFPNAFKGSPTEVMSKLYDTASQMTKLLLVGNPNISFSGALVKGGTLGALTVGTEKLIPTDGENLDDMVFSYLLYAHLGLVLGFMAEYVREGVLDTK